MHAGRGRRAQSRRDDERARSARRGPALKLRRALLGLVALLLVAYAGVLVWFRTHEDAILFHPRPGPLAPPPAALALASQDITFQSSDGTPLSARVIPPPPGVPPEAAAWVLYLHGSGGNVATVGYNEAWALFKRLGLGVLAVDYRGFGASGGVPEEAGIYRDADAAYQTLIGRFGVPPARIVIYGFSLGTAVAIDLATHAPAAGLIVEGAFLSVPARGAELYPYLPVSWLARNRFASVDKIAGVSMPKLFVHARGDTDVPIAHAERLFALAAEPKTFQAVDGGHTDAFRVDPTFFPAIARFVAGLGLPIVR